MQFPRLKKRGPIEASMVFSFLRIIQETFPRLKKRGPIEAALQNAAGAQAQNFRA